MQSESLAKENQTILVVEDEIALRQLIVTSLRKDGFRILEANNPHEAAELIGAGLFEIDLLITDIYMPMMTGEMFAKELLTMRPGLRIIFATGSSQDDLRDSFPEISDQIYIQKPFAAEALRDAVMRALAL
jgi:hypothetical protein